MTKIIDEMLIEEFILVMGENGYEVLNVEIEATDVLDVRIKIGSAIERIFVYIYDDRFILTVGFSCFDILKRDENFKNKVLEQKAWHCLAWHLASSMNDVKGGNVVSFVRPCETCKYKSSCNPHDELLLKLIEEKSGMKFKWDEFQGVNRLNTINIEQRKNNPLMLGEKPSKKKDVW